MQISLFVQCDTCAQWKIPDEFPFRDRGRRRVSDPRQSTCKTCRDNQSKAAYRVANREKINTSNKHYRASHQDEARAYRVQNRARLQTYFKAFYQMHRDLWKLGYNVRTPEQKVTISASRKRWYQHRREYCIDYSQAYVIAHRPAVNAYRKRYRTKNLERCRTWQRTSDQRHRDKNREYRRQWTLRNKPRRAAYAKHRRAKRLGAPGRCTFIQLQARIAFYGRCCWICRAPYEAIDHVKPINAGGSNWPSNLRPICQPCNSLKSWLWPIPQRILERRYQPPD
jgi:hypothetical protein